MEYHSFQMAYVDTTYLKSLWDVDREVRYQGKAYENKPHIGILFNEKDMEYIIPITSAKPKHINICVSA